MANESGISVLELLVVPASTLIKYFLLTSPSASASSSNSGNNYNIKYDLKRKVALIVLYLVRTTRHVFDKIMYTTNNVSDQIYPITAASCVILVVV